MVEWISVKDSLPESPDCPAADTGLYSKYRVYNSDGKPVDGCFVLRPEHDVAARAALISYANATENKALAEDIRKWLSQLEPPKEEV